MTPEERIILRLIVPLFLIVIGLLWWFVFFNTGKDWWRFDVGEQIDTPMALRVFKDGS